MGVTGLKYRFIGRDYVRHDGIAKVTGTLKYTNDIELPRMLYGRILKSPYPHAIVKRINTEKAEKLGAIVITPWTVPRKKFNPRLVSTEEVTYKDWEVLTDHPRFVGEYVAAVAAESEYLAQKALEAVIGRAKYALEGIPKESRAANPDGTTRYMRPMPGAASCLLYTSPSPRDRG